MPVRQETPVQRCLSVRPPVCHTLYITQTVSPGQVVIVISFFIFNHRPKKNKNKQKRVARAFPEPLSLRIPDRYSTQARKRE